MTTAPLRLRTDPGFRRFWAASTISAFGTYITTLAVGVLIVVDLDGSATDVGWVNAARWAPYLLVGLFVGVLADRVRRKPLLVSTDLGRRIPRLAQRSRPPRRLIASLQRHLDRLKHQPPSTAGT